MNSASWDRVAVKFSFDAGITWSEPTPIIVNGIPVQYQRPFDPTLAVISADSLRIYFSSSDGMPTGGLNNIINTYSAVGVDGVHFTFEPDPRFDDSTHPVVDPAIIKFNGTWHYAAPAGAPQDGAFHATSIDGVHFTQQTNYASDNTHNWTGNFMLNSPTELRFYGSGQFIWYNSSIDGFAWQGFTNTNIVGGDPSVVKIAPANYLAVYVGELYVAGVEEPLHGDRPKNVEIFPTVFHRHISLANATGTENYELSNEAGDVVWKGAHIERGDFGVLPDGRYFLKIENGAGVQTIDLIKQ